MTPVALKKTGYSTMPHTTPVHGHQHGATRLMEVRLTSSQFLTLWKPTPSPNPPVSPSGAWVLHVWRATPAGRPGAVSAFPCSGGFGGGLDDKGAKKERKRGQNCLFARPPSSSFRDYTNGINRAARSVKPIAVTPSRASRMVQVFSASTSVRLPIRAKIQKPLSFIQEPVSEPAPMAVAR